MTESLEKITERNKHRADRISGYGMFKRTQVMGALEPAEQDELQRLDDRSFDGKKLTPAQEARLAELWDRAHEAHVPPQVDPIVDYAGEVGDRMRALGSPGLCCHS
jgi:hypothetical protein